MTSHVKLADVSIANEEEKCSEEFNDLLASFLFYIWGFHWVGKALQDE